MTTPSLGKLGGERIGSCKTYHTIIFSPPVTHNHFCRSCGIASSRPGTCLKCTTYGELGHTVAQMADTMRTLEMFGAEDQISALPVHVCDLAEAEGRS